MRVTMKDEVSGTREGQPWPKPGEDADVPRDEALSLIGSGIAVLSKGLVADHLRQERDRIDAAILEAEEAAIVNAQEAALAVLPAEAAIMPSVQKAVKKAIADK